MNKINLFGASGHAKVIVDILEKNNSEIGDVYDDNEEVTNLLGYKVSVFNEEVSDGVFIIAIGSNNVREILAKKLSKYNFSKALHPSSIIDKTSTILEGTVVMAGVIINSSVQIGKHCIINTGATIDHDCKIGDFVHISPNATLCGGISIGNGTLVGAGAVVIPNISIGKNVIIGAGSIVVKNIPDNVMVIGNPSKIIK